MAAIKCHAYSQFKLDRVSLETIYTTFIRPILEYGDILFDNCNENEKYELDKIQYEAARITTGATKLVSIQNLNRETGWASLRQRRKIHKLVQFYKMFHNITPSFLSNLVPDSVGNSSRYPLRNSQNVQTIQARAGYHFNSFLPSAIREWNNLTDDLRNSVSVSAFKFALKRQLNLPSVPKYYFFGKRNLQVLHTRLRTKCSALNSDLFMKNMTDSPLCNCGQIEDAYHYLLYCTLYTEQRVILLDSLSAYPRITSKLLLFGDETISDDSNIIIFSAVHSYFESTNRF